MCTKHQGCQSGKIKTAVPLSAHDSCCAPTKPTLNIAQVGVDTVESSCCSGGSCSSDTADEEGPAELRESSTRRCWLVSDMDCPSCAQKLEKAIMSLQGVTNAKVLFATEKLVVDFDDHSLSSIIEQTARQTGFPLSALDKPKQKKENKGWFGFVQDNLQILSIAGAMAFAGLVASINPQLSSWIFTLTCLLGLYPIARKAVKLARGGTPFAIETLMSVAALGALYLGETAEAAMVLLLFLIGEKLEAYASSRARSGVQALMDLVPENTTLIIDGVRKEVPASQLQPGDVIEVAPGGRLPADGVLMTTLSSFDESALTGESVPVEHEEGGKIMAGAVVVDKVVQVQVTSRQGENAIDRILHLIEEAESRKAPLERFLDKFSRWYTPLMMLVSLAVIVTPPLLFAQPWETWVYRGLALLLIACPCALVISTPAAITSGLAAAARRGALIKGGAALELLGKVESVAFDKTGTLTQGKPQVTDVVTYDVTEETLLSLTASIEVGSSHPLAISLVKRAEEQGVSIPEASDKTAQVGSGVTGLVNGKLVQVIAPSKADFPVSSKVEQRVIELEEQGKTVVIVRHDYEVIGVIAWQDTLRQDAQQAIATLKMLGVSSVMLTGDNPRSAGAIAHQIGLDYKASLLPADKVRYVEQLSTEHTVAMVGDGINDAPAMKASSIGIAMGGGTDVALETADAALTHNRLVELPAMIELSRATLNNIRQNVALALGLKGVFLVTSLLGITGLWVAVLADSGATALVTLNALRLLRFESKQVQ
ncbi:zinc/cadmium/mercury/lead-transporting ATPase [Vibrio parahaemolyticus]|uniref:zinc/cadmium/mercury/lead-transporting ATPase n=1 Tax=Vibrio parahaemolyticus TaxID=670 RepID=UPI0003590C19|nr:zinc/cadmium/mercury/lead-transporting ATPase [Vibrio parahaemolyticus]AGQ90492.1 zinc/cadmium/mercury/lead-transporting ATPase [Vibrio parahaemolyticus O1:Kuk str. FDA_R31]EJB5288344.1 zinc/cadmium/mercury/lead-transporting ATPase [Vibrio parahaemolyticus]EJC7102379.1 zinc/cadmium/mercury/lead-transporting ATPase [Vibrio parahaemolyticus]EJC7106827.1 zinc/cadmium/mercury/lead-transporting ATPase [Vibrio parahaemolyticus]EJG2014722.1 zinc/cadmium/mercury/lead-transporting ATPase [Vibrio par